MEQKQLVLVIVSGLSSYYATNKLKIENDCKDIYVVLMNSFQLMIFSNFLQQEYLFYCFIIAAFFQYRTYGEYNQDQYSKLIILTAVYLLLGGYDFINKRVLNGNILEGFNGKSTDYTFFDGIGLFGRSEVPPQDYYYTGRKAQPQRDPRNQQITPYDKFYRQVTMQDYNDYNLNEEDLAVLDPSPDEIRQKEYIKYVYQNFIYSFEKHKLGKSKFYLQFIVELYKYLVYYRKDVNWHDMQQSYNELKKIVEEELPNIINKQNNTHPYMENQLNSGNRLHIFLRKIVEPVVPFRVYNLVLRDLYIEDREEDQGQNLFESVIEEYIEEKKPQILELGLYPEQQFDLRKATRLIRNSGQNQGQFYYVDNEGKQIQQNTFNRRDNQMKKEKQEQIKEKMPDEKPNIELVQIQAILHRKNENLSSLVNTKLSQFDLETMQKLLETLLIVYTDSAQDQLDFIQILEKMKIIIDRKLQSPIYTTQQQYLFEQFKKEIEEKIKNKQRNRDILQIQQWNEELPISQQDIEENLNDSCDLDCFSSINNKYNDKHRSDIYSKRYDEKFQQKSPLSQMNKKTQIKLHKPQDSGIGYQKSLLRTFDNLKQSLNELERNLQTQ